MNSCQIAMGLLALLCPLLARPQLTQAMPGPSGGATHCSEKIIHRLSASEEDRKWVELFRTGDEEAFEILVIHYQKPLFRYLFSRLNDASAADDVLQETWINMLRSRYLYDGGPLKPWVFLVAHHRLIDFFRRESSKKSFFRKQRGYRRSSDDSGELLDLIPSHGEEPEEPLSRLERSQWLHRNIARLEQPFRLVLELTYFQGKSKNEIAESLKIPVGTVASRLHSAHKKLADKVDRSEAP